jgi:hypothetical protein
MSALALGILAVCIILQTTRGQLAHKLGLA